MVEPEIIKVLLVEDDEDDYIITRDLFKEITGSQFALTWAQSFEKGLEMMVLNRHQVCLVDYRLGAHNGIELLRAAFESGCQSPVILLTGAGEHEIDLEAMQAGAADYLVKTQLQPNTLERSVRYALQRQRATAAAAFEQARLAAFGAEVGLALTRRDSLQAIMDRCSQAMLKYLNAALARIEDVDRETGLFAPLATAGTLLDNRIPPGPPAGFRMEGGPLTEGKPVLIKQLFDPSRKLDNNSIQEQALVSYAAYPLVLEDKLLAVMSIFTQQPLTEQIWLEMASVAHGIALCIQRKRSDEALGLSEYKYRTVVESIKEVIFQLDEFGNWTVLNPAWTAITGFETSPTLGTFFLEYVHRDDRQQNQEIFLSFTERKIDYCRYETRLLTRDGKCKWVEVFAQVSLSHEKSVTGISGTLTDITERKIAETQIQKLAAFPRVNPNPVLEFAMDGTLSYANEAAYQMAKSLGKKDLSSILPPNAAMIAQECLGAQQTRLRQNVSINGRTITWSFFPVASSQVIHCYGADVTDMLSLEAQLRHAQKLESIGQLAAGVAHDFNNILTVIHGYSDSLIARFREDSSTREALCQIRNASRRAAALTRQLLTFSRKQVIQPRLLNLNAVLQNLANMLPRLLGEDIILETKYLQGLPQIEADTGMLEQIVMNLAVNARDAMPNGGKLFIETADAEIDLKYATAHPEARAGLFACLTVTDTGCGMDTQTRERVFEPFFTTKEVGKGTGLGLATVYGIVKQHKGWIDIISELGVGTSFKIYLPAVKTASATDSPVSPTSENIRGGKETILLVEDEPVVRELVRDILQTYDYSIIEAGSGVEALRVWDQHDGKVDLLLTDIIMPEGLNGRELARQLKTRKPELKVIFSSGYSAETLGKDFREEDTAFLPKPYLPAQLAQLVRQRLDSRLPEKSQAELVGAGAAETGF
jgi:two-component system cell cycle sensor histidine kinase/response regulator CckA